MFNKDVIISVLSELIVIISLSLITYATAWLYAYMALCVANLVVPQDVLFGANLYAALSTSAVVIICLISWLISKE